MNNLTKRLLIALFFAFFTLSTANIFAQTDYVITNDGTKIMGEVKNHGVDKVKFKAAGQEKNKKYKPADIKETYKAGHGVFRSLLTPKSKKKVFLQVLEDGKIKLYEYFKTSTIYGSSMGTPGAGFGGVGYGSTYNMSNKSWYAQKDNGELIDIKTTEIWGSRKERKAKFLNLVQDNAHVADRYKAEDKFNFDFVRSLIVEYNTSATK